MILTMVNRKGGVAKTTSVLNLAAEFAAMGRRTLAIDLDPQATLTLIAGLKPGDLRGEETSLAAILPERYDVDPAGIGQAAPWGGDLWPATPDLSEAEIALTGDVAGPNQRLARALRSLEYDMVLVDSPPSIGKLVLNAVCASDALLVPVSADYASAGGLERLFQTVEMVRDFERPDLQVLGIFATRTRRTIHSREVLAGVRAQVGELVMDTAIPQAVAVEDSQAAHQALRQYDPKGKAAKAYRQLAGEILVRAEREAAGMREAA